MRPGAAAARAGGSGAGERSRTRYGANVRAGIVRRACPAGTSRRRRTGGSAAAGPRPDRRRSRRRASACARERRACPRGRRTTRAAARRGVAGTIGTPAPVISRIPTARRCRSTPEAPSGNAARRISRRNVRPRSGSGSSTRPSAATGSASVTVPPARRRTSVGRRTVSRGASRRSSWTVSRRGVVHSSHAVRPSSHEPIHDRGELSNAREARNPGRPWKRPDDSNVATSCAPASASTALSGARGSTVPQPSASHARAAGGAICRSIPRWPSWRSRTSTAPAVPLLGSRRNGSSPVVRSNRYVSPVASRSRPASARSASTGGRSASRTRTPGMRSSRIPPAPSGASSGLVTRAIRTRSERTPRRPSSSRFQPWRTGKVRPATSTAVTFARRSE